MATENTEKHNKEKNNPLRPVKRKAQVGRYLGILIVLYT